MYRIDTSCLGDPNVAQLLREKGADVDGKDNDGYTAVDFARAQKQKPLVSLQTKKAP